MVALYLRLSMSDGDLGIDHKDVSNSIENQKALLKNYLQDHPEITGEVTEYADDGYTGTNFNRPAFKRMIEDCRKGIVNTVLVKDLSRLGRNYIEVGDYVEQLFSMLGIRFISVTQNYDSNDYLGVGMDFGMQINNLVASLYSRDMSKKQRSTRQIKRKQGIAMAGSAPYGYIKNPDLKGRFKVDPEAARVVRKIFEKAIAGNSILSIAEALNEEGIPTPYEYNKEKQHWKNLECSKTPESECLWDRAKVRRIIQRYDYTGAFVEGRTTPAAIGSSHTRKKPVANWDIIDGLNEPIVSKEEYELANTVIRTVHRPDYLVDRKYLLKGKVRCGNCRLSLTYVDGTTEGTFHCNHKRSTGKHSACCEANYSARKLEQLVFDSLKNICQVLSWVGQQEELEHREAVRAFMETDIAAMDKEIASLRNEKLRQYEAYADGHMSKDVFMEKKKQLTEKLDALIQKKDAIQKEHILQNGAYQDVKEITDLADSFLGEESLTRKMVETFIKQIYVYDEDHIEIIYNFEDDIRKILDRYQADKEPLGAEA